MSQPYDPARHPSSEWEWIDLDQNGGYWQRRNTSDKSYNCTEYAMAKLFGDRAEWGGDGSQTTETDEIEQELRDRGFGPPGSPSDCGCGQGKISTCAVLYFTRENGQRSAEPYHVEVFDRQLCDWGGKGGPGSPIRHRQDPATHPSEPAERARTELVFLCKEGEPGPYQPDADIHDQAGGVPPPAAPTPAPAPAPAPQPPPYSPPWLLELWRVLFGLLGLLLGWLLWGR
jgi:hypothetical protein